MKNHEQGMEEPIDLDNIEPEIAEEARKIMTKQRRKKSKVPLSKTGNIEPVPEETPLPPPKPEEPEQLEPIKVTPVFKNSAIEVARDETVKRGVEIAFNNASKDMSSKANKLASDLQKTAKIQEKPLVDGTARSVAINRLLGYKEKYEGKIKWYFKDQLMYQKMSDQQIEDELQSVRLVVNSQDVPDNMKLLFVNLIGVIEQVSVIAGLPYFGGEGRASLSSTIESQAETGYFDSEFEQILVEYGHWFAKDPLTRLAIKTSATAYAVGKENAPAVFKPRGKVATQRWNTYKEKNKDL